jgi:hypothetical protein
MATLQASKYWSAANAQARLKLIPHERPAQSTPIPELKLVDDIPETPPPVTPPPATSSSARLFQDRLPDIEQRRLLLDTVTLYSGWQLISVQHRPESDVLVAHLVPSCYEGDPLLAVRDGRAMQIIMDARGDFKIQRPRRDQGHSLSRLLRRLMCAVGGSYSITLV